MISVLPVMANPQAASIEHWVHPKGFWPGWLCAWPSRDWRLMLEAFLGDVPGEHVFYSETRSMAPGGAGQLAVVRITIGVVRAQFRSLWDITQAKLKAREEDVRDISQKRAIYEWILEHTPAYCAGGLAISAQVDFEKIARVVDEESFRGIMMELGQIDESLQAVHRLKVSELEALCAGFGYSIAELLYPKEG